MTNKKNIAQNEQQNDKNGQKFDTFGNNNAQNGNFNEEICKKTAKTENKTPKTAEQKAEEKTGVSLMELIIAKTYTRHSQLSGEEFLKEIGFADSGKNEEEAIRISIMNVLVETTKQLLQTKQTLNMVNRLLKTYLIDEDITETKQEIADNGKKGE